MPKKRENRTISFRPHVWAIMGGLTGVIAIGSAVDAAAHGALMSGISLGLLGVVIIFVGIRKAMR